MIRYLATFLTLLVLVTALTPDVGVAKTKKKSKEKPNSEASIIRVIDGDTLAVKFRGREQALRLIGIDAPESHDSEKARKMAKRTARDIVTILKLGRRSSEFMEGLIRQNKTVTLEIGETSRDRYKRLLAYVYLKDGRMLNEVMLREGYALLYTFSDNDRYVSRFQTASDLARRVRRGLWN